MSGPKFPLSLQALRNWWKRFRRRRSFPGSAGYWEQRYQKGGHSGAGSYGRLAEFKAKVLNELVDEFTLQSVIEFGCGDGNQLTLARYPRYLGIDVSPLAVARCRERFARDSGKSFQTLADYSGDFAELVLSLDVIYHLIEDASFHEYLRKLFASATRMVVIYSSNTDDNSGNSAVHVRHRKFSRWIERNQPDWRLLRHVPNQYPPSEDPNQSSFADFFIYVPGPAGGA